MKRNMARGAKHVGEVVLAALMLILASPVLLLAALMVFFESGRPIFFRQQRAGLHGKPFEIVKLRTMQAELPPPELLGQVDSGHALVTPSGRLMRRLKVDELTQLLNVLKGEMALVGPRPTLLTQVESYTASERERLEVLPGLTGWAQVNGNTLLTWPERITLDRWYVRHWSLGLDIKILLATVLVVLRGERVHADALAAARAEGL